MGKELSEMTLEEPWDLFPIFLVPHDERWNECYKEIEADVCDLLAAHPTEGDQPRRKHGNIGHMGQEHRRCDG
jgi:hypothetical protein